MGPTRHPRCAASDGGVADYIITAPDEEKTRIRRELDALFDELDLHGDATIDLPYVTRAYRAVRD